MGSRQTVAQMINQYEKVKERLAEPGLLLVGTIIKRMDKRPDPQRPGQHKVYGPYYQWTYKLQGKSRTVNLTAKQAAQYRKAIGNHHQMQKTIGQMRQLSRKILEATTEGVQKRNTAKNEKPDRTEND